MGTGDRRLVVDCPVCKRTIWAGAACSHGKVPTTQANAPKEGPPPRRDSKGRGK